MDDGTSDIYQNGMYVDDADDDNEPDDVIILHMDIRQPLSELQKLVERKLGVRLENYKFWLQDAQELEPHKNLVDQCVKGEGLVQINVQIQTITKRINIIDVLKPTEAALAALAAEEMMLIVNNNADVEFTEDQKNDMENMFSEYDHEVENDNEEEDEEKDVNVDDGIDESECKPCLNWVLDNKFKKEQAKLKIPDDPNLWTMAQVKYWLQWAINQFELKYISMDDWAINGEELCAMTHEEFRTKLKADPGNIFWTHLQLLKECKFVSVVVDQAPEGDNGSEDAEDQNTEEHEPQNQQRELKIMRKSSFLTKSGSNEVSPVHSPINNSNNNTNGSNFNGQVQLWQFLLEILTDRNHSSIIQWVGLDGEFKLTDPESVAKLWGIKKNKPAMNYEKLSRALRYYYDGDMISKVAGKRFAYKFDCDLQLLTGYSAGDLARLVNEADVADETSANYLYQLGMQSDEE